MLIERVDLEKLRDRALHPGADAGVARHLETVAEQVLARRRRDARTDPADDRIRRIGDSQLLLAHAVHAQRLLVHACREPVVEHAHAAAERGLAALAWR